jgi:AraC family transcriptional regulator
LSWLRRKNLNKKEVKMLKPKYVELQDLEVLYVRKTGDYNVSCGKAWEVLMGFAYQQKIKYKKNLMGKDAIMIGIGHDNPAITPIDELRCDACISYDDKSVEPTGEVLIKTIKGGKYVMILHRGSYDGLKDKYQNISDWIVQNSIKVRDLPMFEKYLNRDPRRTKPENLKTEIYVPIE